MAQRICGASRISGPEKECLLDSLREKRNALTSNQSSLPELHLELNLLRNIPPAPSCPFYRKLMVPTVTTYNTIGAHLCCIRLDPSAVVCLPTEVLAEIGDISRFQVEMYFTIIGGYPFINADRPLNLSFHSWIYLHSLFDKDSEDEEVDMDILMGVFNVFGVRETTYPGSLELGRLQYMRVHCHRNHVTSDMLYSPDNAHFDRDPDYPICIFWAVGVHENRMCITKTMVIFDHLFAENAPKLAITQSILKSLRNCNNLQEYLNNLEESGADMMEYFISVIALVETLTSEEAAEILRNLPIFIQNIVCYFIWILFNAPLNLSNDFGRESFECHPSLPSEYHSSTEQCTLSLRCCSVYLHYLLITSQKELFRCQPLNEEEVIPSLMECAEHFSMQNRAVGYEIFGMLQEQVKDLVYFHISTDSTCKTDKSYLEKKFYDVELPDSLRVQALLHTADQLRRFSHKTTQNRRTNAETLSSLVYLLSDPNFILSDKELQTISINKVLRDLSEGAREAVYRNVYINSCDKTKGGKNWAEVHIADDYSVLIHALFESIDVRDLVRFT